MNKILRTQIEQIAGTAWEQRSEHELWMNAPAVEVRAAAQAVLAAEGRLSTMTALALPSGETEVIYHWICGKQGLHIKTCTQGNHLPSITPVTAAANWIEREIMDLYAVVFDGHPDPTPLLRPSKLTAGYYREPGGAAGKAARGEMV